MVAAKLDYIEQLNMTSTSIHIPLELKHFNYEFEFDIERFSNQLNRKIIDIQYSSNNSNYEAIITYEV